MMNLDIWSRGRGKNKLWEGGGGEVGLCNMMLPHLHETIFCVVLFFFALLSNFKLWVTKY